MRARRAASHPHAGNGEKKGGRPASDSSVASSTARTLIKFVGRAKPKECEQPAAQGNLAWAFFFVALDSELPNSTATSRRLILGRSSASFSTKVDCFEAKHMMGCLRTLGQPLAVSF